MRQGSMDPACTFLSTIWMKSHLKSVPIRGFSGSFLNQAHAGDRAVLLIIDAAHRLSTDLL